MRPSRLTVADVSGIHPVLTTMFTPTGSPTKLRDDQKYATNYRSGFAVNTLVPLPHVSCRRLGQPASRFPNEVANLACSTGAADKPSFIYSALQELSVSMCRGSHRIVAAYAALQTRMTGRVHPLAPHPHC